MSVRASGGERGARGWQGDGKGDGKDGKGDGMRGIEEGEWKEGNGKRVTKWRRQMGGGW